MKALYVTVNYIVILNGALEVKYPKKDSCFSEEGSSFRIVNTCDQGETIIPFADVANWETLAVGGVPYSEATMRLFLETETAQF